MKSYGKFTSVLIAIWFAVALSASALQWFRNGAERLGVGVAVAASAPLVVFAIWFGVSKSFREFTLSLSPEWLTFAQTWRVLGVVFLLLEAHNRLPASFALPAGYGDIFIGVTAGGVAFKLAKPNHRAAFIAWQVLGMIDLVTAVASGVTARLLDPNASMLPMTVLPLSLVPTFLVPLFFIFHIISIAQAAKWREDSVQSHRVASPVRAF